MGELIVMPLVVNGERDASLDRTYRAVARLAGAA
jgi:hypothetical protein